MGLFDWWDDWRERRTATKALKAEQKLERYGEKAEEKGWDDVSAITDRHVEQEAEEPAEEEVELVATNPRTGQQQVAKYKIRGKKGNIKSGEMFKKQGRANSAIMRKMQEERAELLSRIEALEELADRQAEAAQSGTMSSTLLSARALAIIKGLVGVVNANDKVQNGTALQLAVGLAAYREASGASVPEASRNWMQVAETLLTAWAYYDVKKGLTSILSADSAKAGTGLLGLLSSNTASTETVEEASL